MFGRRIISCILLMAWLRARVGVPGPGEAMQQEASGEDFPCRGHGCGCRNAEMCRTACCCAKAEPVAHSCCSEGPKANAERPQRETVFQVLKCQGLHAWNVVGLLALTSQDTFVLEFSASAPLRTMLDCAPPRVYLDVPAPPPRFPA
jgi:hypothetical protein